MQRYLGKEERRSLMQDRARKRAEERENQGGGAKYNLSENVSFYSPKKHASLDIIPYTVSVDNHPESVPKGELWYQRTVFVHYSVGGEEKSYLCLKTIKKKCPICEYRTQLMKDSNADEETVKQLRCKERELFNVYDRDDPDKGVQLWDISSYNFGAKLEEELREGRPEWAGFAEPVDGFTLKVRFTNEQIGKNTFMQASRIDFEERKNIDEKLLSRALDLDKILKVLSYEQLEKIFLGVDEGNGGSERQEEGQQASRGRLAESEEEPGPREGRSLPDRRPREGESAESEEVGAELPQRNRGRQEKVPEVQSIRSSSRRESRSAEKSGLVCPVGGTFGKDCDELAACKDCGMWEECLEEQERLSAAV